MSKTRKFKKALAKRFGKNNIVRVKGGKNIKFYLKDENGELVRIKIK